MKPISKWSFRVQLTVAGALGGILLSQGASFARWNQFHSVDQNFNFHALLLVLAGLAVCTLAGSVGFLAARLKLLEEKIADQEKVERA